MARSDNFNRADSTSLTGSPSDGGAAYVTPAGGGWGISSNQAYCSGSDGSINVLEDTISDVTLSVDLAVIGANSNFGIFYRYTNDGQYNAALIRGPSAGGDLRLLTQGSGVTDSVSHTFVSGDVFVIEANGSSIVCKVNGATILTATRTENQTATGGGLRGGGESTSRLDNYSRAAYGSGGSSSVPLTGGLTHGILTKGRLVA